MKRSARGADVCQRGCAGCSRVNDEETHMGALRKQMEADSGLGHGRMRIFLGELECPRVNNEVIVKPRNPSN